MPYQGLALAFMLGVGLATAVILYGMYALTPTPQLEQGGSSHGEGTRRRREEYYSSRRRRRNSEDTICAICHENVRSNGVSRILDCQHVFHKECIDRWFRIKAEGPSCPICREPVRRSR